VNLPAAWCQAHAAPADEHWTTDYVGVTEWTSSGGVVTVPSWATVVPMCRAQADYYLSRGEHDPAWRPPESVVPADRINHWPAGPQ
jgi:hypothetical protein